MGSIRKRHVFFIQGYEPQGVGGFHRMFAREWKRYLATWPVEGKLGDLQIESDDIACWDIDTSGPNWQVSTRYEFIRLEGVTRENLAQPLIRQLARSVHLIVDDIVSGTLSRIFKASGKMGVLMLYSEILLLMWIGLSIAGAFVAASILPRFVDLPIPLNIVASIAAGLLVFAVLKPLADRMFVNQLNTCWPYMREFARGEPSDLYRSVEVFAERIVAAAKSGEVDEVLIVGHSAGAMVGLAMVARALELDPNLGVHGSRVAFVTVGSIMPTLALHPDAKKLREIVRRVAVEKPVLWVDCQSREDFMNFQNFDPVAGIGVDAGPKRCNPMTWQVPIQQMVSKEIYARVRINFFRMHYQYVMSNDRRAPYDYYMFVCGPAPFADWAMQPEATLAAFAADASYTPPAWSEGRPARQAM